MSVYLALHTSPSPNIGDIAKFGETALRLGAEPNDPLAINREANGALTVLLSIPPETATS